MNNRNSRFLYIWVIVVLIFAGLACGSSTTEQLQESTAPTSTPETEAVEEESSENSQESDSEPTNPPTDAPEPTEPVPTPTPEPTEPPPTPTPEPEPITVLKHGFGQDGRTVGYSFIVQNPNSGFALEDSQYQIAALDESGTVVDTDSGFISILLPDQELGVGGSLFVEEGVTVASIDVQLNAGDPETTDSIPTFSVELPTYYGSDISSRVTGIIQSPYDRTFTDLRVSAVVYNESDEIIGGGFTFLNFIHAKSSTGVNVSVTSSGNVARAEIYPVLSALSLFGSEDEIPENATAANLLNQGFGQDDRNVGFGIIVENPNNNYAIENSQYHLTFFASDGAVLGTEEGYLNLLLPGQTTGIGGTEFLNEGQVVDNIKAQLLSGDFVEQLEELPPFTSENVQFVQGSFSSSVTGFIVNPYTSDITDLRVSAIAFNESGEIIGGGFTFLDFAAANGQSAVEVNITVSGVPVTVELYAVISSLSDFE